MFTKYIHAIRISGASFVRAKKHDYSDTASLISGDGRMLQPDMVVGRYFPLDDNKCLQRDWSADTGESNTASMVTSHNAASMGTLHSAA